MQRCSRIKKDLLRIGTQGIVLLVLSLLSGCTSQLEQASNKPQGEAQLQTPKVQQSQSQSDELTVIKSEIEEFQNQSQTQTQNHTKNQNPNLNENQESDQTLTSSYLKEKPDSQSEDLQVQAQFSQGIPVLYYHSIEREEGNELRIPPEEFEAQLKYLYQAGYQSITLDELYQSFNKEKGLPNKAFVMTFDDGYVDNYENAYQIAKKYGFTGTVFMVTGWIDGAGYLSKEQLKEMSADGWQIEGHSVTHPKLNEISNSQLENELRESKKQLEEILQRPVKYIAYPFGNYSEEVIQKSKLAGYTMGFTTERGWAAGPDYYKIKRVYCYAGMGLEELRRRIENPNY